MGSKKILGWLVADGANSRGLLSSTGRRLSAVTLARKNLSGRITRCASLERSALVSTGIHCWEWSDWIAVKNNSRLRQPVSFLIKQDFLLPIR